MIRILEDSELRLIVDRREAIDVIERAYREAAIGTARVSQPSAMLLKGSPQTGTSFKIKGAILEDQDVAGFRCVGDLRDGADGASYVVLFKAGEARLKALVAEKWLHRLRTAATGLVTCRALCPSGAKRIALIGTGQIAEEFVKIVDFALPGLEVVIASRTAARAADVARAWQSFTTNGLSAAPSIPDAVRGADIVVTLSDANERLFSASDLKFRSLVCAMGGRHEFDADVLQSAAHLVVDEMDWVCTVGNGAQWIGSGQITRAELERRVSGTIGEILAGQKVITKDGIVLAIVQGIAICDVALAQRAFENAVAQTQQQDIKQQTS
jgi:ornithine cyclodeaminase/alanine dehydrogenase-like protein (mu-crystallin family)